MSTEGHKSQLMLCGSLILLITLRPSFLNVRDLRTFSSGFLNFLEIK